MMLSHTVEAVASESLIKEMAKGGHVLMLRHAYAPGTGDPDNFKIGDCSTQRNLNAQGRDQARDIGRLLRKHGIQSAKVYASQWCRCLETARLLDFGPVTQLPALNSFFQQTEDREPNLRALRSFLLGQPVRGKLIILVTHFVTISAFTGQGVASGEGVVLRLDPGEKFESIGRLTFDE